MKSCLGWMLQIFLCWILIFKSNTMYDKVFLLLFKCQLWKAWPVHSRHRYHNVFVSRLEEFHKLSTYTQLTKKHRQLIKKKETPTRLFANKQKKRTVCFAFQPEKFSLGIFLCELSSTSYKACRIQKLSKFFSENAFTTDVSPPPPKRAFFPFCTHHQKRKKLFVCGNV